MHFSINEILRWILMGFVLLFMLSSAFTMYQVSQINSYKQIVNSYIETKGKLGPDETDKLNQATAKQYGNEFIVSPATADDKTNHAFGEQVHYNLAIRISPLAFGPAAYTTVPGSAVSQVGQ